jgi:hypothetical protein
MPTVEGTVELAADRRYSPAVVESIRALISLVNSCLPLTLIGPLPFCVDKNEGEDPGTAEATG